MIYDGPGAGKQAFDLPVATGGFVWDGVNRDRRIAAPILVDPHVEVHALYGTRELGHESSFLWISDLLPGSRAEEHCHKED